jgi:hypothetical protein
MRDVIGSQMDFLVGTGCLVLSGVLFAAASPALDQSRHRPSGFVYFVGGLKVAGDVGC